MVFELRNLAGDSSRLKSQRGKLPSQTLLQYFYFPNISESRLASAVLSYLWDYASQLTPTAPGLWYNSV